MLKIYIFGATNVNALYWRHSVGEKWRKGSSSIGCNFKLCICSV